MPAIKPEYWIGFDLGGTKMMAVVFGPDLKPVGQERKKTRGRDGAASGIERVQDTIRIALGEARIKPAQLAGIGIGCPGPVNPGNGTVYGLTNLGWKNLNLKRLLEKNFACPVVIVNDVDAGTYGEYVVGAAKGARSALGVFPGTGVGGGFVYQGEILSGGTISCMELGHLCVQPGGALCGCGRRGCLETVASRLTIATAAAAAAYRGEAPALLKLGGTDIATLRSGVLAQAIRDGDAVVEAIVVNAAEWLGLGIGAVVNLLAPDVVVIGGGLVEAMPDLILKTVRRAVQASVMQPFKTRVSIKPARLGDAAVATGAATWAARSIAGLGTHTGLKTS